MKRTPCNNPEHYWDEYKFCGECNAVVPKELLEWVEKIRSRRYMIDYDELERIYPKEEGK